jgi:hypothetical protein
MPEVLLVDDWQAVTKHNQVSPPNCILLSTPFSFLQFVTLPRSPNVVEFLAEFSEYIKDYKTSD